MSATKDRGGDASDDSKQEEDNESVPNAETCDQRAKEFAEVTGTDEACAHFFLQDHKWDLERAVHAFFTDTENKSGSSLAEGGVSSKTSSEIVLEEESVEEVPVTELKVISWNIDGLDSKNFNTRVKAVCTILFSEKPDIVFLQEVIAEGFSIIDRCLSEEYLLVSGQNANSLAPYFTIAMLRKNRVRCEKQTVEPFPTTKMGRTLLVVEAAAGEYPLTLITAHLESTKEHQRERKKQLNTALQTAADVPSSRTVIFGGDLNCRNQEIDDIGGVPDRLVDIWSECGAKKFTEYTWDMVKNDNLTFPNFKPRCRFDRLYLNKDSPFEASDFMLVGMQRIRSCLCFPSDHFGVMTMLKLRRDTE